ncbi:multidrug effflux MFS transporter [Actinomadura kijaniata]|uniref:DHA1 family bicyclomycin/chloramphenicol resistance-like MFS transporter n=1 Tax=Actinomadura namibiensis TaxID=182080 RepID=A0A7W3QQT3_ACTNM|nr:multidrug effflux MFS transporter [Actinomadura namibiensis]MBA8955946.1 DHA1 family bicyclomycin/chloramphenicol resistance-like MFS transporter [Actinomadura namibiensis]
MAEAPSPTAAPPGASPVPPPASRGRRIRLVMLLGALSAMAPLSTDMYLPALPQVSQDFHTGAAQAQLTLTFSVVGLALGQVVAGPLSDRLGRRRPLLVGMALYTVASLLCALAPSIGTFAALRLVQGAAGAAGIVIARAVVRDLYDGTAAAKFFSTLMLVNGLAPILAPVLGGQLLRLTPWTGVFAVLAGIGVLLFLGSLLWLGETLPAGQRQTGGLTATLGTFRELLADRAFVGYALAQALAFAALFTYISGSPFVLQDLYHLSPQAFSVVFAVNSLGIIAAGQISGRLVGRVRLRRLLGAGLATVTAGGIALLAAVSAGLGLVAVLPALFLVVAGQGLVLPNATTLALSGRPPRVAGSASALVGLAQFALGGAAAPLAGIGGNGTALPMAITIAATALAAAAVLILVPPRHSADTPSN